MNIQLVLLSRHGKPVFYVIQTDTKPKTIDLWERQARLSEYKKKVLLRRFVTRAVRSKIFVIRELARSRSRHNKELSKKLERNLMARFHIF